MEVLRAIEGTQVRRMLIRDDSGFQIITNLCDQSAILSQRERTGEIVLPDI